MKNLLISFIVLACIAAAYTSCEQNRMEEIAEVAEVANVTNENSELIRFKYCGKSYNSVYQIVENNYIYSNKEVQKIQEMLANKPNLATLIDANDNLEYFDNYEELQKAMNSAWQPMPTIEKKATINAKIITHLHINVGFKGGGQTYEIYPEQNQVWVTDMSKIALDNNGLLNKLSSIQLLLYLSNPNAYFGFITLWDQKFFGGHSITWMVNAGDQTRKIKDLSNYHRGDYVTFPELTWNDAAQSLKVGFGPGYN